MLGLAPISDRTSFATVTDAWAQCTNRSQYLVAFYSLKVAGEPDYLGSSGCMLTIDEAYPRLAAGGFVWSAWQPDFRSFIEQNCSLR